MGLDTCVANHRERIARRSAVGIMIADNVGHNRPSVSSRRVRRAAVRIARAVLGSSPWRGRARSEEHTSELQSLMRISYAVFCLQNNNDLAALGHFGSRVSHDTNSQEAC